MKLSAFGAMDNTVVPADPHVYYETLGLEMKKQEIILYENKMIVNISIQEVIIMI